MPKLLSNPLLTVSPTPHHLAGTIRKVTPSTVPTHLTVFRTAGRTAHQVNRDLRKALIFDLSNHNDRPAFVPFTPNEVAPRADDIEALMASYPGLHELHYDNPPTCPLQEIDPKLWLRHHSRHCRHRPRCTPDSPADGCYFKPLLFMLTTGYHAPFAPGMNATNISPHSPAYTHLWFKDQRRCEAAFRKLCASTELRPISKPPLLFPLLPAYRGKHLWRYATHGIDFLPRITSDISTSGGNLVFADWSLRYLSLHALYAILSRGDYLATRDVTGFYNRLPAGEQLRLFQCFQNPASYEKSKRDNDAKVRKGNATFLQQLSCMFGHKQLPTWASVVSSELARILHTEAARVAGTIIDDFLFHGPRAEGKAKFSEDLAKVDSIMRALSLPPNDKGQPPNTTATFSGLLIDSVAGCVSIDEEQRLYVIDKITHLLSAERCSPKEFRSLNGSLGWLCFVLHHGRCRRDCLHKAGMSDLTSIPITRALRSQLLWWLRTLKAKTYSPSPIWFHDEPQQTILVQSDASGDAGFGFCAAGLHVTGCWSPSLAPLILNDMFVKELLPIAVAILLLARLYPDHIFCSATDNAGVAFRLNCGSCRNPLGRALLTVIADTLATHRCHILADWNNREQPHARHTDDLSKVFSPKQWASILHQHSRPWVIEIVIHHLATDHITQATMRLPRLSAALPNHLRHSTSLQAPL